MCGLEVVDVLVVRDLFAEFAPCSSAVRKWMPPHTRALITSSSASDSRSNERVVPVRGLKALNGSLSLLKKSWTAWTVALLAQLCADGWSGNGGVNSGDAPGCWTVAGSNSGVQFGSPTVARGACAASLGTDRPRARVPVRPPVP
jgi:hypothetical protein